MEDFYNDVFLDKNPVFCLHFFKWMAKGKFKREYLAHPPLKVPPTYPLATDYDGNPEGTELEKHGALTNLEGPLRRD